VLHDLIYWLIDTISVMGYPGIVLLMAMESSVLPVPSELVMPPAGYLVAKGEMNGWIVVLCGTVGSILGALANYAGAVFIGEPILRRYGKYFFVSEKSLDKTEAFFRRHGEISTFIGRLLPVIRHLISIPAGLSRMNLRRFVLFTALGAAIWCAILTYIGWLMGMHEEALKEAAVFAYSRQALIYLIPLLVLLLAAYIWWWRRRRNPPAA
jgi:membrane protein DedA with SNARE-associated domain